ncbi:MAG TPA: hypothetical protein VF638_09685 [Sphingomonas sp.]
MDWRLRITLLLSLLGTGGSADAAVWKNGAFRFVEGRPVRIVVVQSDIQVGSIGVGGVEEANADWTAMARVKLAAAIERQQRVFGNEVVVLAEQKGEQAKLVADYLALFKTVATEATTHELTRDGALPAMGDRVNWTLGPDMARIVASGGGDYALFVRMRDSFGTGERKAFRLLTGQVASMILEGTGVHQAFAALVDLKSGDLVWFNLDLRAGGDPRNDAGAAKRIGQLFGGFPSRKPAR